MSSGKSSKSDPLAVYRKARRKAKRDALENHLQWQLEADQLTNGCCREYRFHPTRRWRFDFAWPDLKLAAEVEGGTWSGGRHTTGKGFEQDCQKYNAACELGWTVLRGTTTMVKSGELAASVSRIIKSRPAQNADLHDGSHRAQ